MADNLDVTAGTGTSVATDQVGTDHYQRVKITDGTADSSTHLKVVAEDAAHASGDTGIVLMAVRQDTAASLAGTDADYVPLIVDSTGRLHVSNADITTLSGAVSGTEMQVDIVTSALPTGAATSAKQDLLLTDTQLRATPVPVTTGGLTDTELRATPVPVSGTVATGGLTDTELRAAVVPVELAGSTATIGKLGANSGVDIGDVDVVTMPDADIAVATITTTAAAHATSGDNTVIAAPGASNRIVVKSILVQNESAVATTTLLKSGANTRRRALLQNQGDGVAWSFDRGDEWRLGENEALVLNLSGANSHGVTVDYLAEAV